MAPVAGPPATTAPRCPAWRGVNLGGWLLLEPGPATGFFERHQDGTSRPLLCEWDLMEVLQEKDLTSEIWEHRRTHITRRDFEEIARCGLNAVRLPIGYWIVLGPLDGEPYVGPALEFVDQAVEWAAACGLQVLLDLHGCPGGESGDAPCGRRLRPPAGRWHWSDWNFVASRRALHILAKRYRGCRAVTGISVCNEPSNTVPLAHLCTYYASAVETIRDAGMEAEDVTVVLPAFQRPLAEVAAVWNAISGDLQANVCFDLHHYHCFGDNWTGLTLAQHLREVQARVQELKQFPAVIGEWSLALGGVAKIGPLTDEARRALFAAAQQAAYSAASHGWFFWNWKDTAGTEWDWQESYAEGAFDPECRQRFALPPWSGEKEDPLEELLSPAPPEPKVRFGDTVFLRSFRGTYLDVEGRAVRARWPDKGDWQRVMLLAPNSNENSEDRAVQSGDIVRLLAHTGDFLAVEGEALTTRPSTADPEVAIDFIVHVKRSGRGLQHRNAVFLQSRATSCLLDVGDGEDTNIRARWQDFGTWQGFAVEKEVPQHLTSSTVLKVFTERLATVKRPAGVCTSTSPPGSMGGQVKRQSPSEVAAAARPTACQRTPSPRATGPRQHTSRSDDEEDELCLTPLKQRRQAAPEHFPAVPRMPKL